MRWTIDRGGPTARTASDCRHSPQRSSITCHLSPISRHFSLVPCPLSLVFVFALFARTVAFSFIGLDDAAYTFRNPFVAGGLSVTHVVEAFTNLRHGGIWMPVTYISYMLDVSFCRLTGLPLIGEMHLVNVLLHVVNFLLSGNCSGFSSCNPFSPQPSTLNPQPSTLNTQLSSPPWRR